MRNTRDHDDHASEGGNTSEHIEGSCSPDYSSRVVSSYSNTDSSDSPFDYSDDGESVDGDFEGEEVTTSDFLNFDRSTLKLPTEMYSRILEDDSDFFSDTLARDNARNLIVSLITEPSVLTVNNWENSSVSVGSRTPANHYCLSVFSDTNEDSLDPIFSGFEQSLNFPASPTDRSGGAVGNSLESLGELQLNDADKSNFSGFHTKIVF